MLLPVTPLLSLALTAPLAPAQEAPATPEGLWSLAPDLLPETGQWTNRVEVADIDGDGLLDLLFANGGGYSEPGDPESSRVFLGRPDGQPYLEVTDAVLGETPEACRVIKVHDLNADGHADLLLGNTFQTQSRMWLGRGEGSFEEVTETHLPRRLASVGDIAIGDVDGDGDLDLALADWGPGSNMNNAGGRTMLWLNDGAGRFTDATEAQMPEHLVQFSWDLDFVDVDNDFDLDLVVSCKMCAGSQLYRNDGAGKFQRGRGGLPPYTNNYELEAMDLNGDGWMDLVTVNDGQIVGRGNSHRREHVFQNRGGGWYADVSETWWPAEHNLGFDDNMVKFLDYDSDGDADFLLASLSGPDRLLVNDGQGHLTVATEVFEASGTPGTLAMLVADLNGDHRLDVVEAQGEHPRAVQERIHLGSGIPVDTAAPHIGAPSIRAAADGSGELIFSVRVHDAKTPSMPHDWKSVAVYYEGASKGAEVLTWYGEQLWRARLPRPDGEVTFEIVAVDAAGNEARSEAAPLVVDPPRRERRNRRNR